ncbi:class I SAM-dependent methyltransferase [Alicyclobacillus sp. ALC3]|uniref:class I SAM-dependent methyltransferase n=1 Tax=Alicyclobacillus sp. ALC3 TaxID=2796143 RepID=UPI002378FD02|nr:class I SAM-dependent methyltransferase [Alicyclobacillus sp. ALC3]WDL97303.1 class I SAM-dependent methyltransferase [Alicyclobacillus sp. ALC3]
MFRDHVLHPGPPVDAGMGFAQPSAAVVTTPWKQTPRALAEASRLAEWFCCPQVARGDRSIAQVLADESVDVVIVADRQPVLYTAESGDEGLYFHPSFAWQRIAQWRRGEPERLLLAAEIRPGDTVADATLGRGTDTLVFAAAVGRAGHVIALESSWPLLRLFEDALTSGAAWYSDTVNNLRRDASAITLRHTDHNLWLTEQPDNSVDVVYFDPMFRHATKRRSEVEVVRSFATSLAVQDDAWREAKRVARRCVVLKERPGFGEFERFGLTPDRPHGRTAFAVWKKPRGEMS